MASKFAEDVFGDDLLTCSICFEHFKDPKVLPCLHSFCQDCVYRHYQIYKLCNGGNLSCPTCRTTVPPPVGGIAGFRSDEVFTRVRDILKTLPPIHIEDRDSNAADESSISGELSTFPEEINDEEDDDTSDDETPSRKRQYTKPGDVQLDDSEAAEGAVALPRERIQNNPDPPVVVETRLALRKNQSELQAVIARVRHKMMELYHIENYVKDKMEKEAEEKVRQLEQPSKKKAQKKIHKAVEEKHGPTLAKLLKEQDKLYKKIVEVKSVHDIFEEVLNKTGRSQLLQVREILYSLVNKVQPVVESEQPKGNGDILDGLEIPQNIVNHVRMELENCQRIALKAPAQVKNPRKFGVRLLYKVSGYGAQPGKFDFPTHATFLPNGDLLVSDKNNLRLQVFDKRGVLKQELFNQMIKPRRARVNPANGCVYVSDEQSETVKVFSPDGDLISRIGEGYFLCPAGMDFDSKGKLVMTDPEKNYVSVHEPDSGKLIRRFFFRNMHDKKVPNPYFVAVNEDDQFIISDTRNDRVKIFSSTGQLLFKINKLDCPRGVCVDPYGNILIAEGDKHRIAMYSPYGKFIQYVIDREEFGLCYPLSLDMDSHGRLAITQCGYLSPHEVLVFQMC